VVVEGELPHKQNRRRGAGWWMDLDGEWRAPEEWPQDNPPLEGWIRNQNGSWRAPDNAVATVEQQVPAVVLVAEQVARAPAIKRVSRQAQADLRAMLTVMGVLGGAALLLAVALILITQAGAENDEPAKEISFDVIYAAETDQDRLLSQIAADEEAAALTRTQLEELDIRASSGSPGAVEVDFDAGLWTPAESTCLNLAEEVLVARSAVPVTWADQLDCVPDRGRWSDRYLDLAMSQTLQAEVRSLIPPEVVHESGGWAWSGDTRQAYVTDQQHPGALVIIAAGSGHNPRSQDPSRWRPSNEDIWCAYAVDWVSVKTRWQLDITMAEHDTLVEMLATCDNPSSAGPDPQTVIVDSLVAPSIDYVDTDG
jgi:hypothetical protein